MGNPLRNAMVYLGLAEEQEQDSRDRHTAQTDRVVDHDHVVTERSRAATAPSQEPGRPAYSEPEHHAPVTPITKAANPNPAPTPKPAPPKSPVGAMNEILTVHPKAYDKDAQLIAESFRDGVPVIMNLSQMTDSDARRIIDFASGLTQGLNGRIERVTNRVFLLTPEHVNVHGEDQAAPSEDPTFFA